MQEGTVGQIFFSDTLCASPEQITAGVFRSLRNARDCSDGPLTTVATGFVVALLEAVCLREMHMYINADEETVAASWVECRHRAPIPPGALLRLDGWVAGVRDQEITFCVQASDEQEVVCEGRIRVTVVHRTQVAKKIQRKREAIQRRELFANA